MDGDVELSFFSVFSIVFRSLADSHAGTVPAQVQRRAARLHVDDEPAGHVRQPPPHLLSAGRIQLPGTTLTSSSISKSEVVVFFSL